jgi:hypothetical protein
MAEMIHCPQCQRELQIPEEFIGRPVKCPSCGSNFITTPSAPGTPRPPSEVTAAPPPPTDPYGAPPQVTAAPPTFAYPRPPLTPASNTDRARRAVMGPAVLMLILAPLWLMCDLFQMHQALTMKVEDAARALELFPPGEFRDELEKELQRETEPAAVQRTVILKGIFAFTSLIVFFGAAQMLRLRSWILAVVAGVLTILHFDHCCCVPFNMAAGIYALVVLFLPWVRSAFQ